MESAINNGMCRCCASEGTFKDLKSAYQWMGDEEVYSEMLRECFDITLFTNIEGEVEGGICEVCVTQLRNASNFKKQVLQTEEQFKLRLQDKLFKNDIVKVEAQPDSDNDSDNDHASEDYSEYEVPIKLESDEPKPKKRGAKASTSRAKRTKTDDGETSKRVPRDKSELTKVTKKEDIAKIERAAERDKSQKERLKHNQNTQEVLECTNATPIRNHSDCGYGCCFCSEKFPDPADLKRHTLDNHKNEDLKKASFMIHTNLNQYHVKIDITGLKCELCNQEIDNLELLLEHLKHTHKRKVHTAINNRMIPFKFQSGSQLQCFMCSNVFNKFKALIEHMNVHYRNFICEICDAGFVTRSVAVSHTRLHETGSFLCRHCPRVFDTVMKRCNHERTKHTHLEKLNRCGLCSETFQYYHQKQKHLLAVHNVDCLAKCHACERVYANQRQLRVHIRKDHLMERKFKCTYCEMKFFQRSALRDHEVKHTGLKQYQCELCSKSYGRKKSLTFHMRVHAEDR